MAPRRRRRQRRDERGDTIAFVLVMPLALICLIVLSTHAFIVSGARSEAVLASSEGLRAAWNVVLDDPDADPLTIRVAVEDAVAASAADGAHGWRWWTPNIATVHSDLCAGPPVDGAGWIRVEISGEAYGPLAAIWPDQWAPISAISEGPARLATAAAASGFNVPDDPTDPALTSRC